MTTATGIKTSIMVGIEGRLVSIVPAREKSFQMMIPDSVLIGPVDPRYYVVNQQTGVLGFVIPEVDLLQLTQKLFTDGVVAGQVDGLHPALEEKARTLCTSTSSAIGPDGALEFTFAQSPLETTRRRTSRWQWSQKTKR